MRILRIAFVAVTVLLAGACSRRATSADAAALEKEFQESLTGATLVGNFTMGNDARLREERYTIEKVSKVSGETWLFQARVHYGSREVTVPVPLTVKWAGDTPIIMLTDVSIPGLGGPYTVRLMLFRGQYAGTWSARDHGGHLFGRLVKGATAGGG